MDKIIMDTAQTLKGFKIPGLKEAAEKGPEALKGYLEAWEDDVRLISGPMLVDLLEMGEINWTLLAETLAQ